MQDAILRYREVESLTGLSRTTLWRMERDGTFPKRVRLSAKTVGWLRSTIQEWLASRPAVAHTNLLSREE